MGRLDPENKRLLVQSTKPSVNVAADQKFLKYEFPIATINQNCNIFETITGEKSTCHTVLSPETSIAPPIGKAQVKKFTADEN